MDIRHGACEDLWLPETDLCQEQFGLINHVRLLEQTLASRSYSGTRACLQIVSQLARASAYVNTATSQTSEWTHTWK